jgi:hypothetical protein
MSDQQRVVTLLQVLDREQIAALLDVTTADVHNVLHNGGSLPSSGGGSGLVVGDWEDLDTSTVPSFPATDPFPIPASPVPTEIEFVYDPQPNQSGGWVIENTDTSVSYAFDVTNWGDVIHAVVVRTLIPANAPVQIRSVLGSGGWVAQNVRRRTLG